MTSLLLDWSASVHSSRYRLEKRSGNAWIAEAASISSSTTRWESDEPATADARFRLRGETDESVGAWTEIVWTGASYLPIGDVSNVRIISTHKTLEARWVLPDGIYAVDLQYRKGTSGAWLSASVPKYRLHFLIESLEHSSSYQIRLRSKTGDRAGNWITRSASTLQCLNLAAPPSLSSWFSTGSTHVYFSWGAVAGATAYRSELSTGASASGPWIPRDSLSGTSSGRFYAAGIAHFTSLTYLRFRVFPIAEECESAFFAERIVQINRASGSEGTSEAEGAIAAGSGASITLPAGLYASAEASSSSPLARPFLDGYIEERWLLGGLGDRFLLAAGAERRQASVFALGDRASGWALFRFRIPRGFRYAYGLGSGGGLCNREARRR